MSGWPGLEGIADGIPNLLKIPYDLGTKKFWAASDELFDRFMSTQRAHVDELRELVAATGGPPLLGTPASLVGLERWFLDVTSGPFDDGADWAPTWTVLGGKANKDTGLSRDVLVRMQERVAIYYADVLIDQLPGSQWVCWRDTQCNTPRSGKFTLDIGVYPGAARPIWVAEQVYRDNDRFALDKSLSTYIPPERRRSFLGDLERYRGYREKYVLEHGALSFQAAPTGPEAGKGRGAFKGKLSAKARIALGWT